MKNLNNRRRIDDGHYIELLFLENSLKNFNSHLIDSEKIEEEFYEEIYSKFKDKQNSMKDGKIANFEIEEEGLKTNEFNLYWKKNLILGEYRQWRKKCTDAVWKNEI
jgi:hypothetical protein